MKTYPKVRGATMEILQIKIDLPIVPDYEMGGRVEEFTDAIHAIKGCSETMIHSGSWAEFDVVGATDEDCLKDLARIRKDVSRVIQEFNFWITPDH